ncbi:MAG: sigma-70 family RNA polymerase sigma factor [Planctomycetota bacterium]|nr:sigma-70 family RNA polymerase sigma factor [Planctomycetota bacterium]
MATDRREQLLVDAKSGNMDALIALLEEIGPEIRRRIAPKLTSDLRINLDEDDVMQVTYMEAISRLDRFTSGGVGEFISWLTRLAQNNIIDAQRAMSAAKRPSSANRVGTNQHEGSQSMVALVELLGVTSSTPSMHAAAGEAAMALERALATLPIDYQKCIRMYDLQNKTAAEVAAELGRSEGAVFMLRARAHDRLREAMGSESQYFSNPGTTPPRG